MELIIKNYTDMKKTYLTPNVHFYEVENCHCFAASYNPQNGTENLINNELFDLQSHENNIQIYFNAVYGSYRTDCMSGKRTYSAY